MQDYFFEICDALSVTAQQDELWLYSFLGEESNFVRFNNNKIRQCGQVKDAHIQVKLVSRDRCIESSFRLTGNSQDDKRMLEGAMIRVRNYITMVPIDPHLNYEINGRSSETQSFDQLVDGTQICEDIMKLCHGTDMVGFLASGPCSRGFANSLGQKNWFQTHSFNFDWSLHRQDGQAVKNQYASFRWDRDVLEAKVENDKKLIELFNKPVKLLKPGQYRTYLTPAAVAEILGLISRSSFGEKSRQTKTSPLLQLMDQTKQLNSGVNMRQRFQNGLSPDFDNYGFTFKNEVNLIQKGLFHTSLSSPRSAKEYQTNLNSDQESPSCLAFDPGLINTKQVLEDLGEGLFIGNLWYLNYSDVAACRFTGMTRFACFYVEDGKIKVPINVMRFDESLYDIFGDKLIGLTDKTELFMSTSTYNQRSLASLEVPGALVKDFSFTL